jgi:hypothetical protein
MLIFTCGIAFIVDIYLTGSASALAANTFVRSISAAGASHPFSYLISQIHVSIPFPSMLCTAQKNPSFRVADPPIKTGSEVVPQKHDEAQPCLPSIQPHLLPASHLPRYTNSPHPILSSTR